MHSELESTWRGEWSEATYNIRTLTLWDEKHVTYDLLWNTPLRSPRYLFTCEVDCSAQIIFQVR